MNDCNTTMLALEVATNRLNWYIGLSILASAISTIAIYISFKSNKEQLKANHDWNRRSFSINYLNESVEKIQKTRKELNELTSTVNIKGIDSNNLSFSDRFIRGNALTEEEVHDWICEWDDTKKEFIKEKSDGADFKLTEKGDKIRILLITLINIYESIGSAMQNGVLDKEVVESLMKGPITANYKFFILYIKHTRSKHKLKNAGKNFRNLYRIINPKKAKETRAKTDKI